MGHLPTVDVLALGMSMHETDNERTMMGAGGDRHWRGTAAALLAATLLAVAGCFGERAQEPPLAGGTPSADCGRCHAAIYKEWQHSAHAAAFTREEYKVASRGHKQADCLRCHVPKSSTD